MFLSSWLRRRTPNRRPAPPHFRPRLEALDDRLVPSTLTVTNTLDDGSPGSLRYEIAAAQSGDTIAFDSGLAGQTISLTGGELAIDKSLTIQGTPGHPEAVSSDDQQRVLHITGIANVTLDSLVIEDGLDDEGAGIYNNGGTVAISNCLVTQNSTHSLYYADGGGIYNNGGTMTISHSYLSGNDALFHYLAGGGSGGAIYNNGGTVTISDSTLSGNQAWSSGGGIYNNGGTVTVSNSGVAGNSTYADNGGGIYNTAGGTVTVENSSSATGNIPDDVYNGGVLYLDGTSTIGILNGNPAIPLDPNARLLQIGDATVREGNTRTVAAAFTVTLSAASTQTITVAYATAEGTATAGSDYQAASGTLTFAPGETSKTVTVLVNGDRLAEPNETFSVNLSGPTNATITDGQGAGTIVDDEPRLSISDVTGHEGKRGQTTSFTFTVTLSAAYDEPVTVSYRTVDGTATTADGDYVAQTGTITFAPGETTKTITIVVNGDNKREPTEYFYVDLSGLSSNALFTKNRGTGTILNNN